MGTSSSFNGPVGRNNLLPPWAPPLPEPGVSPAAPAEEGHDDANATPSTAPAPAVPPATMPVPDISWRGPKSAFSNYVSGRTDSPRSAFRSYVRAHGGARQTAHSGISSRRSTARFMGFISSVARDGVVEAARRLGLADLLGRDVQFVLASLVDLIAPAGALLEEAAARSAIIDTIFDFFGEYDLAADGIRALDAMTAEDVGDALKLTVCNVVEARFKEELTSRVERGDVSEQDGDRIFSQIGEFVREMIDLRLEDRDLLRIDWGGEEGAAFVEQLYTDAYSVLENK